MKRAPIVLLLILLVAAPTVAWACCCAPRRGEAIQIADQEILVAWDAKTKTEHFVRRAKFSGVQGKDFGFLVPTPSKPELEAAPDAVFDRLAELLLPEVVTRKVPDFTPLLLATGMRAAAAPPPTVGLSADKGVRVLEEKRVAGFDAAVLEATDAKALTEWLEAHEYAVRPEITEWAEPYVKAKWKVTAFKLPGGAPRVDTSAIRMSFTAEGPLFPYRVPTDNRKPSGLLRVYYVGEERVLGSLGPEGAKWAGTTRYTSPNPKLEKALEGAIPKEKLPVGRWLTAFDDASWPSSGDDLFFKKDPDQSTITPPPIIHEDKVHLPADVIGVFLIVTFFVGRKLLRKKA